MVTDATSTHMPVAARTAPAANSRVRLLRKSRASSLSHILTAARAVCLACLRGTASTPPSFQRCCGACNSRCSAASCPRSDCDSGVCKLDSTVGRSRPSARRVHVRMETQCRRGMAVSARGGGAQQLGVATCCRLSPDS